MNDDKINTSLIEFSDFIFDMSFKDFSKLCVENKVDCYLVIDALTVVVYKLYLQLLSKDN